MKVENFQRLVYEPNEVALASPLGPSFWLYAYARRTDENLIQQLVCAYLEGSTLVDCWALVMNEANRSQFDALADWFVESIRTFPLPRMVEMVQGRQYRLSECVENVPQLSSFEASTTGIVDVLFVADTPLSYDRVGYQLDNRATRKSKVAMRKYGENASKFAALLGLVEIGRGFNPDAPAYMGVRLTPIGRAVQRAPGDREQIIARLLFKSTLFRDLICCTTPCHLAAFRRVIDQLESTTRRRRASAFAGMVDVYLKHGGILKDPELTQELICSMRH